jgi:hypothetical protein
VAYQSVDLLEVWAWGQRVGAVARNPEGALSVFQYTPEWIEGGIALSPLTMPLRQTPYDVSQWDIHSSTSALPNASGRESARGGGKYLNGSGSMSHCETS